VQGMRSGGTKTLPERHLLRKGGEEGSKGVLFLASNLGPCRHHQCEKKAFISTGPISPVSIGGGGGPLKISGEGRESGYR